MIEGTYIRPKSDTTPHCFGCIDTMPQLFNSMSGISMDMALLTLLWTGGIAGFFIIAAKTLRHSKQLDDLERRMVQYASMERRITELEQKLRDTEGSTRNEAAAPEEGTRPKVPPLTITPQHPIQPREPVTPPAFARRPAAAPSRTRAEWEQLIGGKLLNRVGALALTIALGSFLKYAFDNNWISESIRVLVGALTGFLCLAGGYRTHRRGFQIFAQGLVGAGVSILYLSVYASFNFYSLIPQSAAFILMFLVTLIAFVNALYYDSLAEAVLGWAGGFLTPLLLSTGTANEVGLFGYIAILDTGLIAIMLKKKEWYALEPLTLCATWLLYQQWFEAYYTSADLWTTMIFAAAFWLLFLVVDAKRSGLSNSGIAVDQLASALNAVFIFLAMYALIEYDHHAWMGLVTALIASVYALILVQRTRTEALDDRVTLRYGLTALSLAVIATAIQFTGFNTVMAWSAEALLLLWCGRRWNITHADTAGLAVFGLAAAKLLLLTPEAFAYSRIGDYAPVMNHRALAFGVLALAMWAGTRMRRGSATDKNPSFVAALQYGWIIIVFGLLTAETLDFFQRDIDVLSHQTGLSAPHDGYSRLMNFQQMTLSGIWLLYSGILMGVGIWRKYRLMRFAAIALFGFSIVKIFVYDLSFLETLYRIFSFFALGVILLAVSYAYQKYRDVIIGPV